MSLRLLSPASLLLTLLLTLLSGCRTNPHTQVYIDNINAEKRLLEDTLYDLQYDYECNLKELEKMRAELAQVKGGDASTSVTPRDAPAGVRKPSPPASAGRGIAPDDLSPPVVEPGTPTPSASEGSDESDESGLPLELDDLDMTPPKLELGPSSDGAAVSLSDPAELVSRWTPRAQTRPRGEQDGMAAAPPTPGAPAPAGLPATAGAGGSLSDAGASAAAVPPSVRQARRPQWRPTR